ncbi:unnamed protein product [Arctogadus glacialis]
MPPVEASIASWTSLGPARLSSNPSCPRKECAKTDRLVTRSFNASARAARTGNALAMTLAALRRTLDPADGDAIGLVEAALSAHSQLKRDVGDSMAAAVLRRRQVWLAQTPLPEAIRRELLNHFVAPGHVFHPESQAVSDRTEPSSRYNGSLSFHRFPKNPILRAQWIQKIRRTGFEVTNHTKRLFTLETFVQLEQLHREANTGWCVGAKRETGESRALLRPRRA